MQVFPLMCNVLNLGSGKKSKDILVQFELHTQASTEMRVALPHPKRGRPVVTVQFGFGMHASNAVIVEKDPVHHMHVVSVKGEKFIHRRPTNGAIRFGHGGRRCVAFHAVQIVQQRFVHSLRVLQSKITVGKMMQDPNQPIPDIPAVIFERL